MHVYWGLRNRADIYLPDLAKQMQAHGILFTVVLSEPLAEGKWRGKTGSAHQAAMENYSDLSRYQVYAYGGHAMVESAQRDLTTQRGLPAEEFFSDSFKLVQEPKNVGRASPNQMLVTAANRNKLAGQSGAKTRLTAI